MLAFRQIRSDGGPALETTALKSVNGGQITLTLLIKPNIRFVSTPHRCSSTGFSETLPLSTLPLTYTMISLVPTLVLILPVVSTYLIATSIKNFPGLKRLVKGIFLRYGESRATYLIKYFCLNVKLVPVTWKERGGGGGGGGECGENLVRVAPLACTDLI